MARNLKSFRSFTEESVKQLTFVFGRFNPPTIGHGVLFQKAKEISAGGDLKIYSSHSQGKINKSDPLKNKDPLAHKEKVEYLRDMFSTFGRDKFILDTQKKNRTALEIAANAYADGYTKLIFVAGSDRIEGDNDETSLTQTLVNYNGKKLKDGSILYDFKDGIKIVQAGEDRDDKASDVSGMSASKMRKLAVEEKFGDWKDENGKTHPGFKSGLPSGFKDGPKLFNIIRERLGLKPLKNIREHIDVNPTPIRERYLMNKIFNLDDRIKDNKEGRLWTITERHNNFIVAIDEKETKKFFLHDIEPA